MSKYDINLVIEAGDLSDATKQLAVALFKAGLDPETMRVSEHVEAAQEHDEVLFDEAVFDDNLDGSDEGFKFPHVQELISTKQRGW